jgi:hypothetical protein
LASDLRTLKKIRNIVLALVGLLVGGVIGGTLLYVIDEDYPLCHGTPGDWGSAFCDLACVELGVVGGAVLGAIALPLAVNSSRRGQRACSSETNAYLALSLIM